MRCRFIWGLKIGKFEEEERFLGRFGDLHHREAEALKLFVKVNTPHSNLIRFFFKCIWIGRR